MINIIRASFSTCKEKKRLYHFVKQCFIDQLPKIEESVRELKDIDHIIRVLRCLKYLKNMQSIATVCKDTIKEIEFSDKNMSPDSAVFLADTVFPFLEDKDLVIYDKIYDYIQKNMPLFHKDQLKKLERTYYEVSQQIPLSTGIYLHKNDQIDGFSGGIISLDKLKLYGIIPHKAWSVVNIRYQEDTETHHAQLKHDKINFFVQGTHEHDLKDLVQVKQFVGSDKQFCINLPPIDTNQMKSSLQFLNYIDEKISSNSNTFDLPNQTTLDQNKLKQCIQILRKKYQISEPELLMNQFSGNFQGLEVPFNLESILYYLSRREIEKITLTDLTHQEKVNIVEAEFEKNKIDYLDNFKIMWLTSVFDWMIDTSKQGCLNCTKNTLILPSPSDILDNYPIVKRTRLDFISSMLKHTMSTQGTQKIIIQQNMFMDVIASIVAEPLIDYTTNIHVHRDSLLPQPNKLGSELLSFYNEQLINNKQGFETHQNQMEKKNKVKNNSILDINQFSKEVWRNSPQLRCSPRDILF